MNEDERYQTVEQSLIKACREIKKMRAGELPKPSLDDLWTELDAELDEENKTDKKVAMSL